MKNVELTLTGDILTIRVDLTQTFGPSSSGKTTIIASTEGNVPIGSCPCHNIARMRTKRSSRNQMSSARKSKARPQDVCTP